MALEREHFSQMFAQAPSFMAMLRGPEHRFEMANAAYIRFLNGREVVGQTVAEALPEAAEQGYVALLDEVYATGQPYNATGCKFVFRTAPGGPLAERYVDFVYQPIKEPDGRVRGIFVQGVNMTQRTLAERAEAELAG
ncbi:PAS domain-containing protein [Ramlibacter sp.]|uniref:PAS domain-containing protein n=1 Tax=Ramlibacter sp. TaxID=1917967 RepID=UPI0026012267|nr:PAS domain-containing protein [Ramlibacter sp.]